MKRTLLARLKTLEAKIPPQHAAGGRALMFTEPQWTNIPKRRSFQRSMAGLGGA